MTFDPFGDFGTQGYLRNVEREKDIAIVKRLEHTSFMTGIDEVFARLSKRRKLDYRDVLQTHAMLFGAVYPWAGQDRTQTAPRLTIKRGDVIFANPAEIRAAVEHGCVSAKIETIWQGSPGRSWVTSPLGTRF